MRGVESAALAAVEAAEARFEAERENGRLLLYRLRLQATVDAVSPLTVDLVALHGCSLPDVVLGLRPAPERMPGMPHLHAFRPQLIPGRMDKGATRAGPPVRQSDMRMSRRIARSGVILPRRPDSRDRLGVVANGHVLECAGWLGPCWFCTEGPVAHVLVNLPETIAGVAPGRWVGDIVDHPALVGRAYRVSRATVFDGGAVALTFTAGLFAHTLPWAAQLAREMERAS